MHDTAGLLHYMNLNRCLGTVDSICDSDAIDGFSYMKTSDVIFSKNSVKAGGPSYSAFPSNDHSIPERQGEILMRQEGCVCVSESCQFTSALSVLILPTSDCPGMAAVGEE